MIPWRCLFLALAAGLSAGGVAPAQFTYTYEFSADNGSTFVPLSSAVSTPSLAVAGGTITLSLYIREGAGTTLSPPPAAASQGLFGAGVRLTYTSAVGAFSVAGSSAISGNTSGPNSFSTYDPNNNNAAVPGSLTRNLGSDAAGNYARFLETPQTTGDADIDNTFVPVYSDGNKRLFVGRVVFTTGTVTTRVTTADYGAGGQNILNTSGTSIDALIQNVSVDLTPVPEPGLLLAVTAGGLLAIRRWRS